MHRIKLTVAYDGTNYCGWQVQPNGVSIQSTLQKAIENLLGEKTDVTGASRTDSGVHALGQVAVFDTDKNIPDWKYALAINQRLPKDIVVQKSEEVPLDFHPRYTDVEKTYEYRILNRRTQLPKERLYSYFVPKKLNVDKMREAGVYLVGEHDFKSFCSQKTKVLSTVRTIYSLELIEEGDIISIDIPANTINVKVSDEELAKRKEAWIPKEPKVKTGYLARYASMVTSADKGAILQIK